MSAQSILQALPGMSAVFVLNAARGFAFGGLKTHTNIAEILAHHMEAKGNPRELEALEFIAGFIAPVGLGDVWDDLSAEAKMHATAMLRCASHVALQAIEVEKSRAWLGREKHLWQRDLEAKEASRKAVAA